VITAVLLFHPLSLSSLNFFVLLVYHRIQRCRMAFCQENTLQQRELSLSLSLSVCFWRGLLLRKLTKSSRVREHVWWKNKHLQVLENNIFCLLHVDDDVDASSSTCLLPQHACLLLSLLVLLVLLFLWQFPFSFCILLVGSSCPSAATFWNRSSHIIINKLCD
jgi:hypothetical protein